MTIFAWDNIRENWWCYDQWYNPYATNYHYCPYKSPDVPIGTFNPAEISFICTLPGVNCNQKLPTSSLELSVINFGTQTIIISICAYLIICFTTDKPILNDAANLYQTTRSSSEE